MSNKQKMLILIVSEKKMWVKNNKARITQNRRIALFSLWSFNQSGAGKQKDVEEQI